MKIKQQPAKMTVFSAPTQQFLIFMRDRVVFEFHLHSLRQDMIVKVAAEVLSLKEIREFTTLQVVLYEFE